MRTLLLAIAALWFTLMNTVAQPPCAAFAPLRRTNQSRDRDEGAFRRMGDSPTAHALRDTLSLVC